MKHLSFFNNFDFEHFSKGKVFSVVDYSTWVDRDTKKLLGTIVNVVILQDETYYGEDRAGTNKYEKLRFKVRDKQLILSADTQVVPVNPIARVYGDFNNLLSVTCDDVKVVEQRTQK